MKYWMFRGNSENNLDIKRAEKNFKGTFLGSWTIKDKYGNWSDIPVDIFYQKSPEKPEYSNYMGIYADHSGMSYYRCEGSSAFSEPLSALVDTKTGEVIISHYRHDYRTTEDGELVIDGGRDYFRGSMGTLYSVIVKDGVFYLGNLPIKLKDYNDEASDTQRHM